MGLYCETCFKVARSVTSLMYHFLLSLLWSTAAYPSVLIACSPPDCMFLYLSQIHEQRLKAKGYYTEAEIRRALREVHVYKKLHQEKPGFFDTAINTGMDSILGVQPPL